MFACFFYAEKDLALPNCIIIPLYPSTLHADGGINNGTSNVIMKCSCIDTDYQEIRWYSPDEKEITLNYAGDAPYFIQESGALIFPIFNNLHQGIYYCGVESDSTFAANISLTPWTGMHFNQCNLILIWFVEIVIFTKFLGQIQRGA